MMYETKWGKARKRWNNTLGRCGNDAMKALEVLQAEVIKQKKLAKQYPSSQAYILVKWNRNAATYGLNLAFGKDLREEDA